MLLVPLFLLVVCGTPDPPARDHIEPLRKQLYRLQEAVLTENRAAIDSLMSVKALDKKLSSDSLLAFVYGEGHAYSFEQFGNYDIQYTNENAKIDCYIMDSLSLLTRPISLGFIRHDSLWLLTDFNTRVDSIRL